jgi:hypothetical protein
MRIHALRTDGQTNKYDRAQPLTETSGINLLYLTFATFKLTCISLIHYYVAYCHFFYLYILLTVFGFPLCLLLNPVYQHINLVGTQVLD